MAILVIAEHDGKQLKPGTTNTITAASKIGGDLTVLIAGQGCAEAGAAAAKVKGVAKVLVADAPHYAGALAENKSSDIKFCTSAARSPRRRLPIPLRGRQRNTRRSDAPSLLLPARE